MSRAFPVSFIDRQIVDFRAAKVRKYGNFDFQFTTDGVTTRILMLEEKTHGTSTRCLQSLPTRDKWSIDELKRVSRLEDLHIVGVDPGKRELVNCVDMDNPKGTMGRRHRCRCLGSQCVERRCRYAIVDALDNNLANLDNIDLQERHDDRTLLLPLCHILRVGSHPLATSRYRRGRVRRLN